MSLSIPAVVNDYFHAENHHDVDGVVRCFSPEGVVRDEGRIHQGPQAIRAWTEASSKKYNATIAPIDARSEDGKSIVNCRVSGNFPGSPVVLTFAFALTGDVISALEVTA